MRRRRSIVGLALAAGALAAGTLGTPGAVAQDAGSPATGDTLFGAYELSAHASGVQALYNIEGLIPGGTAILDLNLPETTARFGSGPTGYGLASLAYPGGLLVNLDSLISQTGGPAGSIPPYPIKSEAFFPAGPLTADSSQPGGLVQKVETGPLGVLAQGSFPGIAASPLVNVGSISSASRTSIEDGKAISRARVVLGDVSILGGVISIDSVVTDLVAAHNGQTGVPDGGTTVSGVRFLGLGASLTEDGLVLDKAAAPDPASPAGPLGSLLDPLVGPLKDATKPVRDALTQILAQATPQVDDLLAQAGITISIARPSDVVVESGATSRTSSGLSFGFTYKGREQAELAALIDSIPPELKPNLGPIPSPVAFLVENHIAGVSLAPATVSSLAAPPFDGDLPAVTPPFDPGIADPGFVDPGTAGSEGLADPGFSSAVPDLPAAPAADLPIDPISNAATAALPAILVLMGLVAASLLGAGSTKLADNVLAPVSRACPTGQDHSPTARSS